MQFMKIAIDVTGLVGLRHRIVKSKTAAEKKVFRSWFSVR